MVFSPNSFRWLEEKKMVRVKVVSLKYGFFPFNKDASRIKYENCPSFFFHVAKNRALDKKSYSLTHAHSDIKKSHSVLQLKVF